MHRYQAYGLRVDSDLEIPELAPAPAGAGPADVTIRAGSGVWLTEDPASKPNIYIMGDEEELLCHWQYFGQFLIRRRSEILYQPAPGKPSSELRAPLLGVVFGVLLHLRGLFTLHAGAVRIDGRAVAFIGQKGAGKSTTTAALHYAGCPIVTDDVLAVSFAEGKALAHPAFPCAKVLPNALEALGVHPDSLERIHPDIEKRVIRAHDTFEHEPLPLDRIYVLEYGPSLREERLAPTAAFLELLRHSYAQRFLGTPSGGARHFEQCKALVAQTPLYRLVRPRALSELRDFAQFIAEGVRQGAAV